MNQTFDECGQATFEKQPEIVQNHNTNMAERNSGIRTISLGTTKDTTSKSAMNDSHSHANNPLLTNEDQGFRNQLETGSQMSSPARTISIGTTKVLFHLSMTTITTMHLTFIKIK